MTKAGREWINGDSFPLKVIMPNCFWEKLSMSVIIFVIKLIPVKFRVPLWTVTVSQTLTIYSATQRSWLRWTQYNSDSFKSLISNKDNMNISNEKVTLTLPKFPPVRQIYIDFQLSLFIVLLTVSSATLLFSFPPTALIALFLLVAADTWERKNNTKNPSTLPTVHGTKQQIYTAIWWT